MFGPTILAICFGLLSGADAGQLQVITELNVPMTTRDGVILRADVYRPDRGGPYPVLVTRTPYDKTDRRFDQQVKAGYIVVVQDVRGRYASDGRWESFMRFETHDAEDGYDTVQWAAKLPNSTGKVGTFGFSYNAFYQWRLAPLRPPALGAMSAHSIPARYTDLEQPGTIRCGRRLAWWVSTMTPDLRRRAGRPGTHTMAEGKQQWEAGGADQWLWFLPWLDLPREVFEDETEYVRYWLKNPQTDPWKLDRGCKEITVPNLDVVGWYDHANGDFRLFKTMVAEAKSETARRQSRLVVGPWSHMTHGQRRCGDFDFGPDAEVDVAAMEIRWFDHWLKGRDNGVDRDAQVRIFVMGDDAWRDEPQWPLGRAKAKTLFITSDGRANTPAGDGKLVWTAPRRPGTDQFVYDPNNPVTTLHGKAGFTTAVDQRHLADREDILVYQSEPLEERIEVTGNPTVDLYAASSAPDTDWFARLIDVAPDGVARDVSEGMVRARYRNSLDKPKLLEPGEVVKYTIRMNPTSNAFLPGHRIRLDITSSDFPSFDRNHNTAADQNADATLKVARQTVHHGASHATRIVLPCPPPATSE